MKKTLFQIVILCITLYSCKTKKTTLNDDNRLRITNPTKISKVKFVPESKQFQFQLTIKESMPFPEYDFGVELYDGKIYAFLDAHRFCVDFQIILYFFYNFVFKSVLELDSIACLNHLCLHAIFLCFFFVFIFFVVYGFVFEYNKNHF
jgi:hypothetical protein